jgi:flagellar hook-associated protein 1
MSLSGILDMARRALLTQRVGMDVTSHNIANASTPGYSRQRLDLVAAFPIKQPYGLLGTGVTVQHIARLRERFIDQQIRVNNDPFGRATAEHTILSQVEAVFNEPTDSGLSSVITQFFNAFQDLASHPEESANRNAVLQRGLLLSQSIRGLNNSLDRLRTDLLDDVQTKINRINVLSREISDLDVQILTAIGNGGNPNDARDQRDIRIEELSTLANIVVSEDASGSVMVSIGGSVIASRGGAVMLKPLSLGNSLKIQTEPAGMDVRITGGELGGVLDMYTTKLPGYMSNLNQLTSALITRVNEVHSRGFGIGTPPPTGINFFSGSDAASIAVDPAIQADINAIAASQDGAPGDNRVALQLAGILNERLMNGNSLSLSQFYNGMVSSIGTTVSAAENIRQSQSLVLQQLENQREAISGVSIDEEMTNLIKFQRSFDAAARVVSMVDEMFVTIIGMGAR